MLKLNDTNRTEFLKLMKNMVDMYHSTQDEDIEGFKKSIKDRKVSYLTQLMMPNTTIKEAYMVECFHQALVTNFQVTGVRVTDVLKTFRIHIAI